MFFGNHLGKSIDEFANTQTTEFDFEKLDQLIDGLLVKNDYLKRLVRYTKKETLFRLKGDEKGNWRTVK